MPLPCTQSVQVVRGKDLATGTESDSLRVRLYDAPTMSSFQPKQLKGLLIDLSGTLHTGSQPTRQAAQALARRAVRVSIAASERDLSARAGRALVERLNSLDFKVDAADLFTSLSATRALVEERHLHPLLLLSDSALEEFAGLPETGEKDAVVVGLAPERLSYRHLDEAFRTLIDVSKGKPTLVATHKALYYKADDGQLSLGVGPFVSALEQAAGLEAEVCGKPTETFVRLCLESLARDGISQSDWSSIAIVGDDYRNDLGDGPTKLGLKRVLVKTGKYRDGDESRGEIDGLYNDFAALVDDILG